MHHALGLISWFDLNFPKGNLFGEQFGPGLVAFGHNERREEDMKIDKERNLVRCTGLVVVIVFVLMAAMSGDQGKKSHASTSTEAVSAAQTTH
jgi:hypothetical protein